MLATHRRRPVSGQVRPGRTHARVCTSISSDRIHANIYDLFGQDRPMPEVLEQVARLGAQLLMQAAQGEHLPAGVHDIWCRPGPDALVGRTR